MAFGSCYASRFFWSVKKNLSIANFTSLRFLLKLNYWLRPAPAPQHWPPGEKNVHYRYLRISADSNTKFLSYRMSDATLILKFMSSVVDSETLPVNCIQILIRKFAPIWIRMRAVFILYKILNSEGEFLVRRVSSYFLIVLIQFRIRSGSTQLLNTDPVLIRI